MSMPFQSEFPLCVAVCAWCEPQQRGAAGEAKRGAISHGICLRHLKKLRLELEASLKSCQPAATARFGARRRGVPVSHPELNYLG